MRIYIYGVTRSDNKGDNVICETCAAILKKLYPNAKICIRNIDYIPLMFKPLLFILNVLHFEFAINKIKNLIKKHFCFMFHSSNTNIVFVGGQIFYRPFIDDIESIINISELFRIPIYFYGCGTGDLSDADKLRIYNLLNKSIVKQVYLRDDYVGISENVSKSRIVPDVALCSDILINERCKKKSIIKKIGLGVIFIENYNKQNEVQITLEAYVSSMQSLVYGLLHKGYDVELFCNGNLQDYKTLQLISLKFSHVKNVTIARRPKSAKQLISLISNYDFVIASRLHALIISYSLAIPFLGLAWDKKISLFCKLIHEDERSIDLAMIYDQSTFFVSFDKSLTLRNQDIRLNMKNEVFTVLSQMLNKN